MAQPPNYLHFTVPSPGANFRGARIINRTHLVFIPKSERFEGNIVPARMMPHITQYAPSRPVLQIPAPRCAPCQLRTCLHPKLNRHAQKLYETDHQPAKLFACSHRSELCILCCPCKPWCRPTVSITSLPQQTSASRCPMCNRSEITTASTTDAPLACCKETQKHSANYSHLGVCVCVSINLGFVTR